MAPRTTSCFSIREEPLFAEQDHHPKRRKGRVDCRQDHKDPLHPAKDKVLTADEWRMGALLVATRKLANKMMFDGLLPDSIQLVLPASRDVLSSSSSSTEIPWGYSSTPSLRPPTQTGRQTDCGRRRRGPLNKRVHPLTERSGPPMKKLS